VNKQDTPWLADVKPGRGIYCPKKHCYGLEMVAGGDIMASRDVGLFLHRKPEDGKPNICEKPESAS
jgi:hypothetical protein